MRVRDGIIVAATVSAVFLAGGLVIRQLIRVAVDEFYSSGIHSHSEAQARERGVFLAAVRVERPEFVFGEGRYQVREAWIEDHAQTRYRLLFFPRDSLLNTPTLVVRIDEITRGREALCVALGGSELTYDGRHALTGNDCELWFASVERPFPSSVALSVRGQRAP